MSDRTFPCSCDETVTLRHRIKELEADLGEAAQTIARQLVAMGEQELRLLRAERRQPWEPVEPTPSYIDNGEG
jgi:hypothetical protein